MHNNFMVNESVQFGTLLYDANTDFDIGLTMNEPPFARGAYSDHDVFADEGYPAVLVIENAPPWQSNEYYAANPYYHKTTDTWEKVNMELVQKVTHLNLATVASFGGFVDTSADEDPALAGQLPDRLTLLGNYPNPFNPHTNIVFELSETSHLELTVYDMTGRRITTLLDESMPPGRHSVPFNAVDGGRNLPSGLYLYRLSGANSAVSGKMLLVK
ncbi:MAG: T9SS C-terminal target domain-containing protein [Balneolaceae bacterium]|nr:MAG: T9SS C-terminal target domain-containing protein [Balneolaceae bacterium]